MEKEKKSKLKLAINIITYTLAALVVLLMVIFLSYAITSQRQTQMPRIFGASVLAVPTGSMEPLISQGDLIVINRLDPLNSDDILIIHNLRIGDVITFRFHNPATTSEVDFNTHRIIGFYERQGHPAGFFTQGDANERADDNPVYFGAIVGTWGTSEYIAGEGYVHSPGARLRGVGSFTLFLSSIWGFLILIVFPLMIFVGYRVFVLIKVIYDMRMEKAREGQPAQIEDMEDMQRQLEELKAQLEAKNAAAQKPDDN